MMKRLCGILLSLALVLTLLPTAALAEDATTTHQHPICGGSCSHEDSHDTVTWEAVSDLNSIPAGTNDVTNYYCLSDDVELTSPWVAKDNVVLCLKGHTINGAGITDVNGDNIAGKAVIIVRGDVSFTLTDCKGGRSEYGKVTHNPTAIPDDTNQYGVFVDGGMFIMYGGEISGNGATSGGGVRVQRGTFTMYGGEIRRNSATSGGGVYVESTAVFTMHGGTITGNKAVGGGATRNGGGVYVQNGTFNMTGGSITGNEATGEGGGVYFGSGIVNLSG